MTFLNLKGRKKTLKRATKYLVDWEKSTRSKFQDAVKQFLFSYWKRDMMFEEFPVVGSRMKFDFYNASKRVVVESVGRQHMEFVPHFQKTRMNFLGQVKRDLDKQAFCDLNGITLVEISEKDFYKKTRLELEQFFLANGVHL